MREDETTIGPLRGEAAEALRALMAPPGDDTYWDSLHADIMSRLSETEGQAWWAVLSRWARPALAAAAVTMLIAGAAVYSLDADPVQPVEYADIIGAQPQVPVQTAQYSTPGSVREATFQFVMSSNGGRTP